VEADADSDLLMGVLVAVLRDGLLNGERALDRPPR
jgi:hypothetical protein